jgi:hypothetical protein
VAFRSFAPANLFGAAGFSLPSARSAMSFAADVPTLIVIGCPFSESSAHCDYPKIQAGFHAIFDYRSKIIPAQRAP